MSIADDRVDALTPWLTSDLEDFIRSCAAMWEQIESLVGDLTTSEEPYPDIFDPDLAPQIALGYLAQFVGERLPVGITEARAREWIKDRPNSRRGTAQSIFLAAQRTLTGTRLVSMHERTTIAGVTDVDYITVRTTIAQTPDPQAVYNDLRKNIVPADIVLNYAAIVGETWQDVKNNNATWNTVKLGFPNWSQVYTTVAGESTYQRPGP